MSRRLPLALTIALGLGFAALSWGLFSLYGVIAQERDDSRRGITSERNALGEYAQRTLEIWLRDSLDNATPAIEAAVDNPLAPAERIFLRDRGRQLLPRVVAFAPGESTPAKALYESIYAGQLPDTSADPEAPWAQRLRLYEGFRAAVLAGDAEGLERRFRQILGHRKRFMVDSAKDLPFTIALLAWFAAESRPDSTLLAALVRDGLVDRQGARLEPLQPLLLRKRDRFTRPDFEFLVDRVVELSDRAHAQVQDFKDRAAEPPSAPLSLAETPDEHVRISADRAWILRRAGTDRTIGLAIDLSETLETITRAMADRALIEPGEAVVLPDLPEGPVAAHAVRLQVASPRWQQRLAAIDEGFGLKLTFLIVAGGMALVIVVLALVMQVRKQRFVEMKSDFVATVSHELRTPLASIRLMAETLERRVKDVPKAKDYPTRIVRDIDELSFLVENILSFNRLDKGRWTPKLGAVHLSDVLHDLEDHLPGFTPAGREAHLTIEGAEDATLEADEELLKLLFGNLVKNACAYNDRAPIEIRVSVEAARDRWLIRVRDNGVGIPRADTKRVFGDFYRAGSSSGRRGSGLGLSICRKIARAHGGDIRVAETGPEGTTFAVEFPRSH